MSRSWSGGSTRAWRALRAAVLEENVARNGGACQLAYPGEWQVVVRGEGGYRAEPRRCTGVATEVHHLLGRKVTGDDRRYLRATCMNCNRKAGEPLAGPDPAVAPVTAW